LEERLGSAPAVVSFSYLSAYQRRPTRAEPLVLLAKYHRLRKHYDLAVLDAERAVAIVKPADRLFLHDATYDWSALDELVVAAYHTPAKQKARIAALKKLMAENRFPEAQRPRMLKNCGFYAVKAT
jgi:hypothetical protein